MKKKTITLSGASSGGVRVPADVLVDAVSSLLEGARQATRFFVEGQSTRKGMRPAWLEAACCIEVTGLQPGSVVIDLEAPTLAEADVFRFGGGRQVPMFAEPQRMIDVDSTAVDLFAEVLYSAIHCDREHVVGDRGLFETCVRFARATRGRFGSIELSGLSDGGGRLVVAPDHIPHLELLRDETPAPKAVRVAGRLDTISASKAGIVLVLADGSSVSARLDTQDNEALKHMFNERVVVAGIAQFRPSGKLLTIDVEHIGPARPEDTVFEHAPRAQLRLVPISPARQDATVGVSAFFGTWPGEETDEELLAALEAIR